MNWPTLVLAVLIALLQYPLWLGKGGWFRVWDNNQQLQAQRELNQKLEQRNAGLDAEVRDLKSGYEAIEERARYELGMIKDGEIFVQVPQKGVPAVPPAPTLGRAASAVAASGTAAASGPPAKSFKPLTNAASPAARTAQGAVAGPTSGASPAR